MKEEIISLEADFANNEFFGTNVWTEEKYRVISGNTPILISAPHSVNQFREEDIRDAEKYTGALVRYLSNATNSYGIFEIFTHADPNTDETHLYKNAVVNIINGYNIKLLIDIHSSTFKDDTDIDIVTNNRESLCGMDSLIDKLKVIGIKYNVTFDEQNIPNDLKANEIIGAASLICGIPSIRLVINNKRLDVENDFSHCEKIIKLLEDFIAYFNYS